MTTDITSKQLVHTIPGATEIPVEHDHLYPTPLGPLPFDLYRPTRASSPSPAVVFVTGLPDPGVKAMLGQSTKDWASYMGWARMVAASGMAGITYVNREPGDVVTFVRYLRENAASLGIDPERIGVWACSGHVPTALALVARERLACAALLYGYLMDLDGATSVADGSKRFYYAVPPVTLDELPKQMPMLVVRAGADTTPGLEETLQRFVAAARGRGLPLTLLDHPEAPHAFDLVDDSPATRVVIEQVLAFLRQGLLK
jgi:dienelactone hydrolase